MRRSVKLFAVVGVFAIVATACGGGGGGGGATTTPPGGEFQQGGTLRVLTGADIQSAWDPTKEYEAIAFAFYRCCFTRTLLSYPGIGGPAGSELQPDLATDFPENSEDGLTWTFTLKSGVTYAPPFQDTEIVAGDFVRAIERLSNEEASTGGYPFYYSVIDGFDDSDGEPGSIPGITAPDDTTLVVTTTEPTGDLPFRFSMPATGPIPEGATDGHVADYGRFLVSSGPYMFEGSDALDFSVAADKQKPVAGYEPGKSWVLVRNPAYDPDTDGLRPAYPDRIEVTIGGTAEDNFNKVEQGEADFDLGDAPPNDVIRRYKTDPNLQDKIFFNIADGVRYISMNLAIPPFDDIHVRKAVNFVIDKDGLRLKRGGADAGDIATHTTPDTLEGDALADFDPYPSPNGQGDVDAAKEEMKQSKYDSDGDGVCDAPECEGILTITDQNSPYPDQNAIIEDNLSQIGLKLDIKSGDRYTFMYAKCQDPKAHAALCPSPGWFKDYADASTFGIPLFRSDAIGSSNYSLLGASSDLLSENGYDVTEVPSADDKINECAALPVGDDRVQCWADLDQFLMEEVVPWVPFLFDTDIDIVADTVLHYDYDQSAGAAAMDHFALVSG